MSRKREPVAEIGADDYRIVRHTHDVALATELMRTELLKGECSRYTMEDFRAGKPHTCTDECQTAVKVGTPQQVWVRVQYALPGTYAEAEGWAYAYHEYDKPGRGAFPAVVFR